MPTDRELLTSSSGGVDKGLGNKWLRAFWSKQNKEDEGSSSKRGGDANASEEDDSGDVEQIREELSNVIVEVMRSNSRDHRDTDPESSDVSPTLRFSKPLLPSNALCERQPTDEAPVKSESIAEDHIRVKPIRVIPNSSDQTSIKSESVEQAIIDPNLTQQAPGAPHPSDEASVKSESVEPALDTRNLIEQESIKSESVEQALNLVEPHFIRQGPHRSETTDEESVKSESAVGDLIIEDELVEEESSREEDSSDDQEDSSEDESTEEDVGLPSWLGRSPSINLSSRIEPPPLEPSISPKSEPSSPVQLFLSPRTRRSRPYPSFSPKTESSSPVPMETEPSLNTAAMVPPSGLSYVEPASSPPFSFTEYTVLGDEYDVEIYTICLEEYLDEMDDDHEALTATWLAKARVYQHPTLFPRSRNKYSTRNRDKPRKDPFANIKPQKTGRKITFTGKAFSQLKPRGETTTASARISSSKATLPSKLISTEVPNYTHYTKIRANVLGTNTRQLQVWPYFGEDVDDDGTIRERFDVIVEDRPRKVLIAQQVSTYGPYFEAFLEEVDCPMDTILKYLLEASEGPDGLISRMASFSNDHKLARKLVRAKDKFCKEDFDRTSQRWVSVASSLPEINDEILWKAAVVCHAFWIRTNFSPWQIARKYAKFPNHNMIEGLVTFEKAKNYASVACTICQLHDCPFHGTIRERPDVKEESDEEDVDSVDALDVDYPPRVNFKEQAIAPFEREIECDPDLCASCEADVILDPVNRYDNDDLPRRCRNVAIQRSVPKRTLLGRSVVHGFGLYSGELIAKDEFVGEYQGEIITRDETERRGAIYDFQKLSYIFDLNRGKKP
ncbi:unnamed protein product [Aureobasidium uvarum]|uniref:SET domain-containing protein n=1 Tax=Aureobasidium uvarum TaxID=2773716 RepID=A0A9N8KKT0_9PEZI|nr:unnamed protein product [Aureobasidium uvarum]